MKRTLLRASALVTAVLLYVVIQRVVGSPARTTGAVPNADAERLAGAPSNAPRAARTRSEHGPSAFPASEPTPRLEWSNEPRQAETRAMLTAWIDRQHLTDDQTQAFMRALEDERQNSAEAQRLYTDELIDPHGLPPAQADAEWKATYLGRDARGALSARVEEIAGPDVAKSFDEYIAMLLPIIFAGQLVVPADR